MRTRAFGNDLGVMATAGNNVVLLGMDIREEIGQNLLGFAIERTDHTEGEKYWLRNSLLFEGADANDSESYDTINSPLQTFRWGDYTAKPSHDYSYRIVAITGTADSPGVADELTVRVRTEGAMVGNHEVIFNRGAAASQQYASRFKNRRPSEVPNREAYKWLSRGLEEALLAFIGQATDSSWALRGALYQFSYPSVLNALRVAADNGVDLRLVVEADNDPDSPRAVNMVAVDAAGLGPYVTWREHGTGIAHNKFIVAVHHDAPMAVWTGSTNVTEGGIFGHLNVGHGVWDPQVAAAFLQYWAHLRTDPTAQDLRPWVGANPGVPVGPPNAGSAWLFSPRTGEELLDWYTDRVKAAQRSVFLTAPFGVTAKLLAAYKEDGDALRYVLLDNRRGGVDLVIRDADPDNQVSVGGALRGGLGKWFEESTLGLNTHAIYVHTKIMLIDPFSDDPIVISGSANFSPDSVKTNDENMLVIRGDTAVADVYVTEFMRMFTHYEFRYAVSNRARAPATGLAEAGQPVTPRQFLAPDSRWVSRWYEPGSARDKERRLFAGM
jgi:phosphatidylserine/phosphatidylglycerophosphate/cardiolipin synthase-like enzyme